MYFHFKGGNALELTDSLIDQNGSIVFGTDNFRRIHQVLGKLLEKLQRHVVMENAGLSLPVIECLMELENQSKKAPGGVQAYSSAVEQAIHILNENIDRFLTIEELADQVGFSLYYFAHLFKAETGYSVSEFQSRIKITAAKTLLKTTNQNIAEIAEALGFSSSPSFIRAFKKRTSLSPLQYRKS